MAPPRVSIIMPAYNRADTLPRAVESVLDQNMPDWELIIVDDGSIDNTLAVIKGYEAKDARIKGAFHQNNLHVHAALNTGFDLMQGEWFTALGSDDEIVPNALNTMLNVLETVDPSIDAITCNCMDTTTGNLSGKGLDHDQWLDFETLVTRCSGEHWGITKRSLLGKERLNPRMRIGDENILWWKIGRAARRYYVHQPLRIYHTEGTDRLCHSQASVNLQDWFTFFCEIASETEYLKVLKQYRPATYHLVQRNIALAQVAEGKRTEAWMAYAEARSHLSAVQRVVVGLALRGGRRAVSALAKAMVRRQRNVALDRGQT